MDILISAMQAKTSVEEFRTLLEDKAKVAGVDLQAEWLIRRFMRSLRPDLAKSVNVMARGDLPSWQGAVRFALVAEQSLRHASKPASRDSSGQPHRPSRNPFSGTCHTCGKKGHKKWKCPQRSNAKSSTSNSKSPTGDIKKGQGRGVPPGSCFQCGSTSHLKPDCPSLPKVRFMQVSEQSSPPSQPQQLRFVSLADHKTDDGELNITYDSVNGWTLPNLSEFQPKLRKMVSALPSQKQIDVPCLLNGSKELVTLDINPAPGKLQGVKKGSGFDRLGTVTFDMHFGKDSSCYCGSC